MNNKKPVIHLENAKQVMEALLSGEKLIWRGYGDDELGESFMYLSEFGDLLEEDGAGLKGDRFDLTYRGAPPNWRIIKL